MPHHRIKIQRECLSHSGWQAQRYHGEFVMPELNLKGTKVAIVIAPEQFRDEELFTPKEFLQEKGAHVTIASTKLEKATGMLGGSANPDVLIKDLEAEKLDAIVVVGGMGSPEFLWSNNELHQVLKEMASSNKVVSAICLSGAVLANAGVLNGKKATVWETEESKQALVKGGATYVANSTVQDGRIITANGPTAAQNFAMLVGHELAKVKV